MFRHPCLQNWQDLGHLNGSWALQNFHLEEPKLIKDMQKVIDFLVTVIYNTL